jgi:hypothetical protein
VRRAGRGIQSTLRQGDRAQVDVNTRVNDHAQVSANARVSENAQVGEIPVEGAFK